MESSFPLLLISLSTFFKCRGWLVGYKVQHLYTRWPFLWIWVQNNCIFISTWFPLSNEPLAFCLLSLESFLCMDIFFQHLETIWLFEPQKNMQNFSKSYVRIFHFYHNQKKLDQNHIYTFNIHCFHLLEEVNLMR